MYERGGEVASLDIFSVPNLTRLVVWDVLTEASLQPLSRLSELRYLMLESCAVTAAGRSQF